MNNINIKAGKAENYCQREEIKTFIIIIIITVTSTAEK